MIQRKDDRMADEEEPGEECGGTMREVVEGMVMRRAGDLCEGGG